MLNNVNDDTFFGPIIMLVQLQIDETQMHVPSPCVNLSEESGSCGLDDQKKIFIHLFGLYGKSFKWSLSSLDRRAHV